MATSIGAAVSGYAHALDAGRTAEVVALFAPGGVSEIVGLGTFAGQEELQAGYAALVPAAPQLHLVANTVITPAGPDEATAVSDLAFFQRGAEGWALQLIGRYDDTLRRHGDSWLFERRVTTIL
ncbi:hypothetical protein BJ973_003807 [Actinoplanes tereljensis]|uniref:SnoaL-like domain-containing protein n=1 Tax=Paractinoplanes tereljensis TaxID=571912 RepID=A0A919NWH7_9ACTN|nr:nuclear transport factor 2 family protein [Actinoplanes tereljensis]GIF25530.1 hypothetical protein Ate02nite_82600 [Actinoplanes tereljensis]